MIIMDIMRFLLFIIFLQHMKIQKNIHIQWWDYRLKNTVTDNGDVSRGICTVNQEGKLDTIVERTQIEKRKTGIVFTEDKGQTGKNWMERHWCL